jgi:hypothetical protein
MLRLIRNAVACKDVADLRFELGVEIRAAEMEQGMTLTVRLYFLEVRSSFPNVEDGKYV